MRSWFQSQLNRSVQLYVELTQTKSSDGMPLVEPKLLAFLNTSGSNLDAFVFKPEPLKVELGKITTVFQAKQIIENALKS